MHEPYLIAVMGPTASGKSNVAETLAKSFDAKIINADAFQIYRGMDIGTAKPKDRSQYELLDIREPDQEFGVGEYVILASELLHSYYASRRNVILCGGTGLYIRALLEEYRGLMPSPPPELRLAVSKLSLGEAGRQLCLIDSKAADEVDLQNEVRVKRALERATCGLNPIEFSIPRYQQLKVGIIPPIDHSNTKIKQRTFEMFQNGWVAEVEQLLNKGYKPGDPGFRALGYGAIADHIQKSGNEDELVERIEIETVQYAKRQRTWLRAEPKLVVYEETSVALNAVEHLLQK
jgi:tRNA dimethylallyltransferase